ncbi:MAG: DUF4890 domain-containing protein [Saprospiraceae bacterium]|nr:DUF4890 domain-containing protein [Saprospiraceae bacterium]MDW8231015.1 DUF4890 domain-containing protein [Saprospiraceae bacterium]
MKYKPGIGLLASLWMSVGVLLAQPGGEGRWMNPEQRAEQQTAMMKERLSLSDAQAAKVLEINVKYARQMQDARQKNEGDWEAMRAQMTTIRQAQDQELQTVLTQEQWQQWLAARQEMRERRGNWGPNAPPAPPTQDKPAPDPKGKGKKDKKNRSRGANPNGNR